MTIFWIEDFISFCILWHKDRKKHKPKFIVLYYVC